jgi:hypothetical protein
MPINYSAERIERFVERVPFSGCWIWIGFIDWYGYGRVGKKQSHRVAYELVNGPIPEGLVIDHLCRVRCCVNPAHLEAVTRAVNNERGAWSSKTHCAQGHEFDVNNTGTRTNGGRYCKECQREANRVSYRKRVDTGAGSLA